MLSTRDLPEGLVASLPDDERAAVRVWWAQLPPQAQRELAAHWDSRAQSCGHSWVDDGVEPRWEEMPILVGARFLPIEEQDDPGDTWNADFYEYLVNNPELAIHFNGRFFHICRAHPVARTMLKVGVIPAAFRCPQETRECPMEKLVRQQPGLSIVLFGRRPPRARASAPEQALDHLADAFDDAGHADAE
jgi:hypothetical protein